MLLISSSPAGAVFLVVVLVTLLGTQQILGQSLPFGNLDHKNLTFVISARNLPNLDTVGQSDAFLKAYYLNPNYTQPEEFGVSEVIEDNPNPSFVKVFSFLWKRGFGQKWNFKVREEDRARPDEEIGEVTVDVDEYVKHGENLTVELSNGGELIIEKTTPIKFKLYVKDLPTADPFNGLPDPYVKCYWRRGSNGENIKFYQTSVQNDVTSVDWYGEEIEFANYIPGRDQWFVFRVKDSDTGKDDELGEALVEIDPFVQRKEKREVRIGKSGESVLGIVPVF